MSLIKYQKLSLLILLIGLLYLADTSAQTVPEKTTLASNTAEFSLIYDFTVPGNTTKIKFTVVVPRTIPDRQRVTTRYTPKPAKIFSKNGNKYAEFLFINPKKQCRIEINLKAEIFRYDLSTAKTTQGKKLFKGPCFENFLKDEKHIEKNSPKIQQIAKKITGQNDLELVENIYNYVVDNIEYGGYNPDAVGAVRTIEQRRGDCTEYSYLFVALCRAKNIPAKVISGYTTKFGVTPKHNWVEVYLSEYGWVPFDPTFGDKKDPSVKKKLFNTLEPIYISRTPFPSDEMLNGYEYYWFQYWGDEVEVESSIEFKKSVEPTRSKPLNR